MDHEPDYYAILGVAREAGVAEIKVAYRRAVREHHPDAVSDGTAKAEAHEKIQAINAAWTILSVPASRAAYDERRRRAQQQAADQAAESRGPSPDASGRWGRGTDEDRKKSRVQAVMGGTSSPRPVNPRTRLLAMVFDAAHLYHVEGRAEDAARVCRDVLRADPTNAEAAVLLSDIYAAQNQRAAALDLLERALRLQPSNVLYRSKWEALRNAAPAGSAARAAPPTSARAAQAAPWNRKAEAPLSTRLGQGAREAEPAPTAAQPEAPVAEAAAPPAGGDWEDKPQEPDAVPQDAQQQAQRRSLLERLRSRRTR